LPDCLGRSSAINPLEDTYKAGKIFVYSTILCYTSTLIPEEGGNNLSAIKMN